jgi:hypothetical protein
MGNVISSIKTKIIRLGFIIFKKIKGDENVSVLDYEDEEEFKKAVSHLIKYVYFEIDSRKRRFISYNTNCAGSVRLLCPCTAFRHMLTNANKDIRSDITRKRSKKRVGISSN